MKRTRILALAGYDSFLNTVKLIAPYFEKQGASVDFSLVNARKKKQISVQQVKDLGFEQYIPVLKLKDIYESGKLQSYDIVLSCLEGMSTRRLFHYIGQLGENRPLVISVYPGLVLRYAYDGFSMRAPADLLWLNCKKDMEDYASMCIAFGVDPSNARLFGNASLLDKIERFPEANKEGPIVFFEQAVIPKSYEERKYLVEQLCSLARRYPEKEFLIKARASGTKAALHRSLYPIDRLFVEVQKSTVSASKNITLTGEPASSLLGRAAHCITISSTVAIEAINADIPTTLISDFGAYDDYGLQYFYGSGLLSKFSELKLDEKKACVSSWANMRLLNPEIEIAKNVSEAIELSRNKKRIFNGERKEISFSKEFFDEINSQWGLDFSLNRGYLAQETLLDRVFRVLTNKAKRISGNDGRKLS